MPYWIVAAIAASVLVVFFLLYLAGRYKRCPSDKILVIYGKVGAGQSARCIHGGGVLVLPLGQDYRYLSLTPMTIQIDLQNALSLQNIRINVPSTCTVGISTDPAIMNNAAERLLNLEAAPDRGDGERDHLRPTAPHRGLPHHRADQPGPGELPGVDPQERRARTEQDRPHSSSTSTSPTSPTSPTTSRASARRRHPRPSTAHAST